MRPPTPLSSSMEGMCRTSCSFTDTPYDTKENEPDEKWMTVKRAIEVSLVFRLFAKVSNVVAFNVLVDTSSIENVLLFESDVEARKIMDGKVRKVLQRSC